MVTTKYAKVEIVSDGTSTGTRVLVDGKPIMVRRVTFEAEAGHIPMATVEVVKPEMRAEGVRADLAEEPLPVAEVGQCPTVLYTFSPRLRPYNCGEGVALPSDVHVPHGGDLTRAALGAACVWRAMTMASVGPERRVLLWVDSDATAERVIREVSAAVGAFRWEMDGGSPPAVAYSVTKDAEAGDA